MVAPGAATSSVAVWDVSLVDMPLTGYLKGADPLQESEERRNTLGLRTADRLGHCRELTE